MLFVIDGDTLATWTRDSDSDRTSVASWATVSLPKDATLMLRGDTLYVATTVGSDYDRVAADGTLSPVTVPTDGAVPVATTGDTITWGTNRGDVHLTSIDGDTDRDVSLVAPGDDATITRWVGGDTNHVYVAWDTGGTTTLAVHSLKTGKTVATHALKGDTRDATTLTLRDGSATALGTLIINTTTGAITESPSTIQRTLGDSFLIENTDGTPMLLTPGGGSAELVGDDVEPVANLSDQLIVSHDGQLLALTAHSKGGARMS